jgi:hypothetical protein
MALDLSKIPPAVLGDIRERGHTDEKIAAMTPREAFREFCNWNSLPGWGDILFAAVEDLKNADVSRRVMFEGEVYCVVDTAALKREGYTFVRRDGGGVSQWIKSDDCYPV